MTLIVNITIVNTIIISKKQLEFGIPKPVTPGCIAANRGIIPSLADHDR